MSYQEITRAKLSTLERSKLQYLTSKIKYDLIYKAQCADLNCDATYIVEVGGRLSECIIDQSFCDNKSHLYKHAEKIEHINVNIDHFEIFSNDYKNNKFKRKLAEALHVKNERPTLNVPKQTVSLKLFN